MSSHKTSIPNLELIDVLVFKPSNFNLKNTEPELESQEYTALNFQLNNYNVKFRTSKITPTKIGQFVTLWKRNDKGITVPFDLTDPSDFYMIAAKTAINFGVFIFPKAVLHDHKIISDHLNDGKRGIRVYPIWDETISKQAQKTQFWQTQYFLDLSNPEQIDLNRAKNLLTTQKIDS